MKNKTKLILCFWLLPLLISCQSATPRPADWLVKPADEKIYANSPTAEDLILPSHVSLFLIRDQSPMVSNEIAQQVKMALEKAFTAESRMIFIREDRLEYQLKSQTQNSKYKTFDPRNKLLSFQLAQDLNADTIGFLDIQKSSSRKDNPNAFEGKLRLEIFQSKNTDLIFSQIIDFDSQQIKASLKKSKPLIQSAFPLLGYILSSRENHKFVQISLGRSSGIKLGRKFTIHKRSITPIQLDGKPQKSVLLSPIVLAVGKVVYLQENEAWIEIKKKYRAHILQGMSVKSLPEKQNLLW